MNLTKQWIALCYTLVFLMITTQGYSQFKKIKLGKITDEYKEYTDCDFAPGSGAVILKNDGHSYFSYAGGQFETSVVSHQIIKILNKDGLDAANIGFRTSRSVNKIKAVTYNLKNGKWEETAFERKNLFKEKVVGKKRLYDYKIPMPNVSEGSIIEVYIEQDANGIYIPTWYFQDELPVVSSTFRTSYPNDFIFSQRVVSNYPVKIHDHEDISQNIGNTILDAKIYGFTAENIPPLNTDESFSPSPFYYSSHVEFDLTGINSTVLKNQKFTMTNYGEMNVTLIKSPYFGEYMTESKGGLLKKLGVNIADGEDEKNAKAIYKAIQEKIEWNEYYSQYPEKAPHKTISDGEGETPDINMLLVTALREAGIKAFPVLLSTRSNGKPNPIIPNPSGLDYMICALELNDKKYVLLDASRDELSFGMIPYYALNGDGYLVDLVRGGWISLQEDAVHEEIYVVNLKLEDEKIIGSVKSKLGDYGAYNYYFSENEEEVKEEEDNFKESIATDWEWEKCEFSEIQSGKPMLVTGEISKEIDTDDLIYVEPSLFQIFNENPFKELERENPVNIPYRIKYKLIYSLEIPEGYVVEEKPSPNKILLPDGGGKFVYAVNNTDNKLSVNIIFDLKKHSFSLKEYPLLHEFSAKIQEQMENMIVLKKL